MLPRDKNYSAALLKTNKEASNGAWNREIALSGLMIPKHLETQYHSHIGEYEKRGVMGEPTDEGKTLEN